MSELSIRRYEPADHESVVKLHHVAMVEVPAYVPDDPEPDLADVEGHYLEAGGEFLVGTVDDDLVATAAYGPVSRWRRELRDEDTQTAMEVRRCRVHPDHQRQGLASAMYDELERRASEAGVRKLLLDVGVENEPGRQFFEAQGFEHVEERTVDIDGNPLYLALYRKSLEP